MEPSNKVCSHCPPAKRKAISSNNFSVHMKRMHNARYQELKGHGGKYCKYPEFQVDFEWAGANDIGAKQKAKASVSVQQLEAQIQQEKEDDELMEKELEEVDAEMEAEEEELKRQIDEGEFLSNSHLPPKREVKQMEKVH